MDKTIWPIQIYSLDYEILFPSKVPTSYSIVAIGIPAQWKLEQFESDIKKQYPTITKVERLYVKDRQATCFRCGLNHPFNPNCSNKICCANCGQSHIIGSPSCPVKVEERRKHQQFSNNLPTINNNKVLHAKSTGASGEWATNARKEHTHAQLYTPVHNVTLNEYPDALSDINKKLDQIMNKMEQITNEQTNINASITKAFRLINSWQKDVASLKEFIIDKVCPYIFNLGEAFLGAKKQTEQEKLRPIFMKFKQQYEEIVESHDIKQNEKPILSSNGTNLFGGVLVAVHKSIHTQRIVGFDNIPNLIALEIGVDNNKFQLVTCYSPPHEQIPFKIFDRILQINENTIITGDFNAKHNSWSRSIENPKGKTLFNWLSSLQTRSTMDIINKFIPTSTRSNATIDLIITPSHMSSNSFSVLPSIGNDHHPVIWCSTIKIFTAHQTYPIKRTHWKLFETFKPTLPQHIVYLTNEKRLHLKLFRRTYHLYYAMMLRDTTKLVQKTLFQYKRKLWLDYCGSFNDCDTKSFWQKAKRHFHSKSAPVEGFVINNSTVSTPDEMCAIAKDYYEEQFADHQHTQTDIDIEARINEKELNEILINIPSNPMNINYQQLCRVVASMKKKNSSGIDGVS
ncbi:unnamed protein product, partial [Rotaria magnacalcarata]